jgi:hypothetical protein
MDTAIAHFRANISYVRELASLHNALREQITSALDLSDILRSEIVMVVSALDYYIHEVVELGMIEEFSNTREHTNAFLKFGISMKGLLESSNGQNGSEWLRNEIRNKIGHQSFQNPNKISDALRLISNVPIWDEIAEKFSMSPQDVKDKLDLIVDRRNKIAHEADIDPTYPSTRWAIDEKMTNEIVNFIENLVTYIHGIVSRP